MADGKREVTRSNLRKLKTDLSFAREGYDLLQQKRDILLLEIMRYVAMIKSAESEFQHALDDYYREFRSAAAGMGEVSITTMAGCEKTVRGVHTSLRRFVGMSLPHIKIESPYPGLPPSFTATSPAYDRTRLSGTVLVDRIVRYASLFRTVLLLSRELMKVQRQVNSLEKIFIPDLEGSIRYIADRLEEREREEIFIRRMMARRKE